MLGLGLVCFGFDAVWMERLNHVIFAAAIRQLAKCCSNKC